MLAQAVMGKLLTSKGAGSKFERAAEAIKNGSSIIAALHGEFGNDFLNALNIGFNGKGDHHLDFDAGTRDYIKLRTKKGEEALVLLRDELNVNLDRLVLAKKTPDEDFMNYFRGVLNEWRKRYYKLLGRDDEARKVFDAMDVLLEGQARTFRDVLEMLSKTSIGGVGALMVISGVLLATSTGVGVVTAISTFLFGIPWLSVGVLVIPGALLIALSRVKFGSRHAMTTCVKLAYRLLQDRQEAVRLQRAA